MDIFRYSGRILPEITLLGYNGRNVPRKNLRRVSEDYIFYIVTSGELFFVEDGKEYHLQKGDCFLFEPGKLHFGTKSTSHNLFYIHFSHPDIEKITMSEEESIDFFKKEASMWMKCTDNGPYPSEYIYIPKIFTLKSSNTFSDICDLANKAIEKRKLHLENFNIVSSSIVTELFVELQRNFTFMLLNQTCHNTKSIHLINEVQQYLNINYKKKITGALLEKDFSYNFDYLNHVFKEYAGTSIFKMLEMIRMETAKKLLLTSNMPVKEIGVEVGISDETYFSKIFKKYSGYSPSIYRKNSLL